MILKSPVSKNNELVHRNTTIDYRVMAIDRSKELCKLASDFKEKSFEEYIKKIPQFVMEEYWLTDGVRSGRGEEKWLNLLLRKVVIR